MEREHIHHLITEEIYLLPQDKIAMDGENREPVEEAAPSTDISKEESESIEKPVTAENEEAPKEAKKETPAHIETQQESPEIPHHDLEDPGEIPFAVFHNSHDASDIELLHKIIDACKLPHDQYKIFGGGFDQTVHFKKALVFVPEAKAFYTPIPYKNSMFLCSKPLDQISGDVQEKAKLWGALQKFV